MRTETRRELLDALARHPGGATQTQIADALGARCPHSMVLETHLRELIRDGAIERQGSIYRANGHTAPAAPAPAKPETKPMAVTTKTCSGCQVDKPLDDFHKHALGKLGRDPKCKACKAAASKARRSGVAAPRPGKAAAPAAHAPARPQKPAAGGLAVDIERTFLIRLSGIEPIRLTEAQLDEIAAWWKQARASR